MDWKKYDSDELTIKRQNHDEYGFLLNSPFVTEKIIKKVSVWMRNNSICYLDKCEREISDALLLLFWSPSRFDYCFDEGISKLKRLFEDEKEEIVTETEVRKTALFNSLVTHLIFRGIIKL